MCFEETTHLQEDNKLETYKSCSKWVDTCWTHLGLSEPGKFSQFCTQAKFGVKRFAFNATYKSPLLLYVTPHVNVLYSALGEGSWVEIRLQLKSLEEELTSNPSPVFSLVPNGTSYSKTRIGTPDYIFTLWRKNHQTETGRLKIAVESEILNEIFSKFMLFGTTQLWIATLTLNNSFSVSTEGPVESIKITSNEPLTAAYVDGYFHHNYVHNWEKECKQTKLCLQFTSKHPDSASYKAMFGLTHRKFSNIRTMFVNTTQELSS